MKKEAGLAMTQRILVVDDNRENVRLVRTYLERSNYEVLVAHDGEAAIHLLRRERPDLVLLDMKLPERDDWDVTHAARSDVSLAAMPLIMLATSPENHYSKAAAPQRPVAGPEPGVDHPAAKPFDPREVVAHVRAVLCQVQGEPTLPKVIQVKEMKVDLDAHRVEVAGQAVHLTPTEFGLLRALVEQPGHALTRQEMIEKGLGYSYEGLERTVDSHVKNLRQKLDQAGEAAYLVETVFGVGYRLDAGDNA